MTKHRQNRGRRKRENPYFQPGAPGSADLRNRAKIEMASNGLRSAFEPECQDQIEEDTRNQSRIRSATVRDLRDLLWSSIDNVDSQDLDQIEYAERLEGGQVRVMVGIADVDAFVPKGSPIDLHARGNTTSVYTGVMNFPMLPDALSYDMTSLLPDVDRLAVVIDLVIDKSGKVCSSQVYRAMVRNKAKLDYRMVGRWLDEGGSAPDKIAKVKGLPGQLLLQNKVKEEILAVRNEHGSLFLQTIEARAVADQGVVLSLELVEQNPARDLIENLMIAANVAISKLLDEAKVPSIKRVVRVPERWPKIVEMANSMGWNLPNNPDAKSLQAFLLDQSQKDPTRFPDLSLRVVKLLGKGEYIIDTPGQEDPGHFALAVNDYTHATAPNRRYVDLVTQRLIKAVIAGRPIPYNLDELNDIALECTRRSDTAKKVERTMRKVAAASLLAGHIGEVYDAIVTGVKDENTYVRLLKPPAEGRVVEGAAGLDVGDEIKVKLLSVDQEQAFIDFACVD